MLLEGAVEAIGPSGTVARGLVAPGGLTGLCISDAPVGIITERLVLRPFELAQFPAYEKLMTDPGSFEYSDRGPLSGDEAWTRFLRHSGHWSLLGYGLFGVTARVGGEFLGEVGFGDFHRGFGEPFDGHPEASWTIVEHARGKGLASEAASAALLWLQAKRRVNRTVCLIHAENAASIRIAEKLGYRAFEERIYRGYRALLFERPAVGGSA